jgi:hypothetical protein
VRAYLKKVRALIKNLKNGDNFREKTIKNCINGHHRTPLQVFQRNQRVTKNRKIIDENNCLHLFENIKYKQKY